MLTFQQERLLNFIMNYQKTNNITPSYDEMREYFHKMEVNVIYSGPYSYSAAPIETLFSALKRGNLNPENKPTGKK